MKTLMASVHTTLMLVTWWADCNVSLKQGNVTKKPSLYGSPGLHRPFVALPSLREALQSAHHVNGLKVAWALCMGAFVDTGK